MAGSNLGFEHQTHRPFGIEYHGHSLGWGLGAEDFDNGVVEDLNPPGVNASPNGHLQSELRLSVAGPSRFAQLYVQSAWTQAGKRAALGAGTGLQYLDGSATWW